MEVSIIIPVRNEKRLIGQTVDSVIAAGRHFRQSNGFTPEESLSPNRSWELVLVDNASTDGTSDILERYNAMSEVITVSRDELGAARARNRGRHQASGRVLIFVDADTTIPEDSITQIANHCQGRQMVAGITSLGSLDGGVRSALWWRFWNLVRLLPLARAKAMPALMFCTAETFDRHGPFDEQVAIGEEWPILAGLYRESPRSVIYDRSIVARSSSRRMDRLPFGYTQTFLKYVWAIVHQSGRIHYTDTIR